ncbi:MAG: transposase [Nitrosomonas sp.]|uniref:transposase n=1 Tax=Nitrosomonas sp. TaxID=42353 RepID=UPI002736A17E|nr:transposase [Nitrosomonas sp.]MDP3280845.1 transposase [Nitrosomonas sp.]MDP3664662.1 transposase [Nitrosomonas sp.]MDZ4106142.1 transposase [Nitrosomonas sp.]
MPKTQLLLHAPRKVFLSKALPFSERVTMSAIAAQSLQHEEAQQRLQTLVGVDPLVGMVANTLERVLFRNADAFVVFTAFDPIANNSGHKTSLRRLSKRGPGELRRLAYPPLPFNF